MNEHSLDAGIITILERLPPSLEGNLDDARPEAFDRV
jgi:hypothetical protein